MHVMERIDGADRSNLIKLRVHTERKGTSLLNWVGCPTCLVRLVEGPFSIINPWASYGLEIVQAQSKSLIISNFALFLIKSRH